MLNKMGASQSNTGHATGDEMSIKVPPLIDIPLPTIESIGTMKRVPCSTSPVLLKQKDRKAPPIFPKMCKLGAIAMGMDGHMYRNAGSRWVMIKGAVEQAARKRVGPKGCPTGKVRNPATNRCVMPKSKTLKASSPKRAPPKKASSPKACPAGKVRNQTTKRCRKVATPKRSKRSPKVSPKKSPKTPKRPSAKVQSMSFNIMGYADNGNQFLTAVKTALPNEAKGLEGIGYDKYRGASYKLKNSGNREKIITVTLKAENFSEAKSATADNLVRDINDATGGMYNMRLKRN